LFALCRQEVLGGFELGESKKAAVFLQVSGDKMIRITAAQVLDQPASNIPALTDIKNPVADQQTVNARARR